MMSKSSSIEASRELKQERCLWGYVNGSPEMGQTSVLA